MTRRIFKTAKPYAVREFFCAIGTVANYFIWRAHRFGLRLWKKVTKACHLPGNYRYYRRNGHSRKVALDLAKRTIY